MNQEPNKVDRCVQCGMCRTACPVFEQLKNEKYSPRGRAFIINQHEEPDLTFYDCTLCGACRARCAANVAIPVVSQREKLVESGKETEANRRMIQNIRKYGNPFGKVEKGKVPKELYCC